MTAQIGDTIRYAGQHFTLVGVSPDNPYDKLFDPERFGIQTFSSCTACWQGYVAAFGIQEKRLMLEELAINIRNHGWDGETKRMKPRPHGTAINGVLPVQPDNPKASAFSDYYHSINLPLSFTGSLLLGKDFIQELYEHGGSQQDWKYQKVLLLSFADGVLTVAHSRTAEMAITREAKLKARKS